MTEHLANATFSGPNYAAQFNQVNGDVEINGKGSSILEYISFLHTNQGSKRAMTSARISFVGSHL